MDSEGTTPSMTAEPRATVSGKGGPYEIVASYETYAEAQRAVDLLSDRNFEVQSLSIVAEGLSFVERITGQLNWWRALLNGLGSGALIGALLGFIFGIFNFFAPLYSALTLAFYGLIFGALLGAIIGLVGYAFSGGKRDFTSVSNIRADRYDVTAHPDVAGEARQLLTQMPVR